VTISAADRLQYAHSPAGEPIAEYELEPGDEGLLPMLAAEARQHGASRLCVYSTSDLSEAGFARREGYRRFTASDVPVGDSLPVLDPETVAAVWPRAFVGQWGHHLVQSADFDALPGAIYVGLSDGGDWLGLCRAEPERRLLDGPGFVGQPGSAQQAQALVLGACAQLDSGPVTLETWGDRAEPYLELGFSIAEECPGWELALT
jgi:hypothetical protein